MTNERRAELLKAIAGQPDDMAALFINGWAPPEMTCGELRELLTATGSPAPEHKPFGGWRWYANQPDGRERWRCGQCQRVTTFRVDEPKRCPTCAAPSPVQRCDQCNVELTPENRHISGLMCISCALPVMDSAGGSPEGQDEREAPKAKEGA